MTRALHHLDDRDLAAALRDLGDHLDLGPGGTVDGRAALVTAVLDRLDEAEPAEPWGGGRAGPGGRGRGHLLVAAIAVVVVGVGLFAVAPTREAIADWFGVDGLRITRTERDTPDPAGPEAEQPGPPIGRERPDLAALVDQIPFAVRLPPGAVAGSPLAARIDPGVPTGLLEVRYRDFTLVALASRPGGPPVLAKNVGPATTVEEVTVGDEPGLWLTGAPHQLSFLGPDGEVLVDSVRRAGDVLIWPSAGVTYRIEGHTSLAAALEVARAMG